ncbi:MAG: hypothetical protein GXP26_18385 [Planctomycetes bacterium]|nr:hypothetical protein [Planctomycetota bacterium]
MSTSIDVLKRLGGLDPDPSAGPSKGRRSLTQLTLMGHDRRTQMPMKFATISSAMWPSIWATSETRGHFSMIFGKGTDRGISVGDVISASPAK